MGDRCVYPRREFLKRVAAGAAGIAAGVTAGCPAGSREEADGATRAAPTPVASAAPGGPGPKVVMATHSRATLEGEVQPEAVEKLVDAAVVALTGEKTAQAAWNKLFSSDESVGVKVNGLGGPFISTSRHLTAAVVSRLLQVGVKAERITIWDQNPEFLRNCGLIVDSKEWGTNIVPVNIEWTDAPVEAGKFRGRITTIVTKRVDCFVNLPIMKDHGLSGVTLALKQHYGTHENPWDHHDNNCDPYIADLNTIPSIRDKQRLILCDATRAVCQDGPGFNADYLWHPNMLMAALDPVAHDTIGTQVIEARRKEVGLPTLAEAGRPAKHIATAAQRGLGVDDPARITVERLNVG
mgnify:CR=1 FL=1